MITHLDVHLPPAAVLSEQIASVTRPGVQHWADAQVITADLLGSATAANIFVIGMAVQAGCLPIDPAQLEHAIALNGVAVTANTEAFRWGRTQIANPEAVATARAVAHAPRQKHQPTLSFAIAARIESLNLPGAANEDVEVFAAELAAFQAEATTVGWLEVLERVAAAERAVDPASTVLVRAVAANLYKLTAYKDEYEVARLMTDEDAQAEAREVAGTSGKTAWKLHPPMLRALGLHHKITIGAWAEPAIRTLARGKRLRGTALDPFGRAEVRRVERELAPEYIANLDTVLGKLSATNLADAVTFAELPDLVRGYEGIKLANVVRYRQAVAEQLAAFR